MKVSVSVLSSSIDARDISKRLDESSCDYIHLDIMDGQFVENKTWSFNESCEITSFCNLPIDAHFMVMSPEKYVKVFSELNIEYFTFHYEAVNNLNSIIKLIKSYGMKVGIAICPNTKEEVLFPFLKDIDMVLVMSVVPGKSGQKFINDSLLKIKNLKRKIELIKADTIISVDGGINNESAILCKEAGATMIVSASYVHNNIVKNVNTLKNL